MTDKLEVNYRDYLVKIECDFFDQPNFSTGALYSYLFEHFQSCANIKDKVAKAFEDCISDWAPVYPRDKIKVEIGPAFYQTGLRIYDRRAQ